MPKLHAGGYTCTIRPGFQIGLGKSNDHDNSFKTTGIQPFNRFAITLPGGHQDTTKGSDDKQPIVSSVAFIPFCAEDHSCGQPHVRMSTLNPVLSPEAQSSSDDDLDLKLNSTMVSEANHVLPQGKMATISEPYTEKKLELFQKRYENGYDLLHDDRYNAWVHEMHSNVSIIVQLSKATHKTTTPLKARFVYRTYEQEEKPPTIPEGPQMTGRTPQSKVLTSEENIKQMEYKARRKEEETRRKQKKEKKRTESKRDPVI